MASDTSDLFDRWFRVADQDRDGRISGQEAVAFYQRSGLNQETLFKVASYRVLALGTHDNPCCRIAGTRAQKSLMARQTAH